MTFDIGNGGTTSAGIVNSTLDTFDITGYLGGNSAVFVWVHINSTTDLTNFVLKIGTDSSNYYSKTITARHDGNAFQSGWNLLRFALTSLSETGAVTDTNIRYVSLAMTKAVTKVNETDYKFNWLMISQGVRHEVVYYSKYGWQDSTGTYIEKSTDGNDLLVADTSEYDLFLKHGVRLGMRHTAFSQEEINDADKQYIEALKGYSASNPDESQLMVSTYHRYV